MDYIPTSGITLSKKNIHITMLTNTVKFLFKITIPVDTPINTIHVVSSYSHQYSIIIFQFLLIF